MEKSSPTITKKQKENIVVLFFSVILLGKKKDQKQGKPLNTTIHRKTDINTKNFSCTMLPRHENRLKNQLTPFFIKIFLTSEQKEKGRDGFITMQIRGYPEITYPGRDGWEVCENRKNDHDRS